jgi:hypothetical protein
MSFRSIAKVLFSTACMLGAAGCSSEESSGGQPCAADDQCQAPARCIEKVCVFQCAADSECEAGLYCSEETGACLPGCRENSECESSQVCQKGTCLSATADLDQDDYPARTDCDDRNPSINPAASETCNGLDDNCNSGTDEGLPFGPLASRQDGVCQSVHQECGGRQGWIEPDYESLPHYEATEATCDGRDNDCDGEWDEGLVPPAAEKHDGVCAGAVKLCRGINGWEEPDYEKIAGYESYESGDCDGIDSDCTGQADEQWDRDGDGYYTRSNATCVEVYEPQGLIDCDDEFATYNARCVIHVDDDATGLNDGTTWANAMTSLQDALATFKPGYQIWVAAGTYRPDVGVGKTAGDRNATFQLVSEIELYGGFAGSESTLAGRDFDVNKTTLSGDLNGDDGADFSNMTENSISVLKGAGDAILDGFWVVGGNGSSGGGLSSQGPGMNVTIRNSTFMRNRASQGGAIFGYWSSGPIIVNSRFIANRSSGAGGAIFGNWSSQPTVYGGLFVGNTAGGVGGAIAIEWSDTANIVNSTFASNTATAGGAIALDSRADASIVNSVFWGNGSKPFDGTGFVTSYSCLQLGALGTGNTTLSADPFASLAGADATAGNLDDDLHLKAGNSCRNSGNNSAVPAELKVDLEGNSRIQGTVDRGVYETP